MLTSMKREDIAHLANLALIRLTEKELATLGAELSSIMEYVGVVSDIAADDVAAKPEVGARFNVFRKDEVTNEPDEFTDAMLAEMPATDGRYMVVKKILNTND